MAYSTSDQDRLNEQFNQDPYRGTIHLLGCRQQIMGKPPKMTQRLVLISPNR